MTPPLFLIGDEPAALPAQGEFRLTDLRGGRAARARRLRPGDEILLGDGQGATAKAVVTSVGRDQLELTVAAGATTPRPVPRVAVVQRVATPAADALAVAQLTGLGAGEIAALATGQVLRDLEARRTPRAARWRAVAREAAERSGRAWLPRVGAVYSRDGLQRRFDWGASGLVVDQTADTSLSTVDLSGAGELVLVVGDTVHGWVERVRLDEYTPDTRDAAVAAMAVLAARLGF